MNNYGHTIRIFIATVTPFLAMFQLVVRDMRARSMPKMVAKKEQSGALATAVILVGVGWGNFTHSYFPVQTSTLIVAAGVVLAIWANFRLLQTVRSERASPHDPK